MSFRDYTPPKRQPQQQGLEFEPENGISPHGSSSRYQRQTTPLRKTPVRRSASNNVTPVTKTPNNMMAHDSLQFSRSRSDSNTHSHYYHQQQSSLSSNDNNTNNAMQQSLLVQQREEEYAMQVMQQREEELRDINRKMHTIDAIYKDLGEVVDQQQDQIDSLEDQFGRAADATNRGLAQIEKANKTKQKKMNDNANGEEQGIGDKKKQFVFMHYLSKSASELSKMVSACTGSGSASYVDGESWTTPRK